MKYFAILITQESLFLRHKAHLKQLKPKYIPLLCTYGEIQDKSINHIELIPGKEIEQVEKKIGPNSKVKVVLNRLDSHIEIASKLVDHFKVPGPSEHAVEFFRDKAKLHQLMEDSDLSFYRPTSIVSSLDEIDTALKRVQFPVVIKPYIGAHSRAVIKFNNRQEFDENRDLYVKHFSQEKALKLTGETSEDKVLIEEFIDGKFVVPCSYIDHRGKVINLAFLKVTRSLDLGLTDLQLHYRTTPSKYSDAIQKKISYILQRLTRLTGLKNTFIDPEFLIQNKRVYLIELNPRMGGFRYETMKHAFGVDIEKMSLQLALGQEVDDDLQEINSCTACEIWEERSGIVKDIVIPKSKYIKDLQITVNPGEEYIAPPDGNKAIGKFYVKTTDEDSLSRAKKLRNKFKIVFE